MKKYLDNEVFNRVGYLNEINRLYLHPLGLHMSVENNEIKIYDFREKKEGLIFSEIDEQMKSRSQLLVEEYGDRSLYRINRYGWSVQPLEETIVD